MKLTSPVAELSFVFGCVIMNNIHVTIYTQTPLSYGRAFLLKLKKIELFVENYHVPERICKATILRKT